MVYGFARQSEGHTRIHSEVGRGTTVQLYLPRFHGRIADAPGAAGAANVQRADRGETVLVIEDEGRCAKLVIEVLNDLGYRALQAADGPAGLKLLRASERIDLLVADVGLPGMNGRQVARRRARLRADLKSCSSPAIPKMPRWPTDFSSPAWR